MLKQSQQNILFYLNLVLVLKLQNVFIQSLFLLHSLKLFGVNCCKKRNDLENWKTK